MTRRPTHLRSRLGALVVAALVTLACARDPSVADAQPMSPSTQQYAEQVQAILHRGFRPPRETTPGEYADLSVAVTVVIGADLHFRSIVISRRCGNVTFDGAVEAHIASLLTANPTLPAPPDDETRARFIGRTLTVRFVPAPARPASSPKARGARDVLDAAHRGNRAEGRAVSTFEDLP